MMNCDESHPDISLVKDLPIRNPTSSEDGAPVKVTLIPENTPDVTIIKNNQREPMRKKMSEDIIYEDGLPNDEEEDVEYKVIFEDKPDEDGNDVEIDVRGVKYKIPFAIECHLCNEMMNLCLRRTRYRGQTRDYPAYRCNRKGCQTFRSIRKVFHNCVVDSSDKTNQKMVYQPTPEVPKVQNRRAEFSEDDNDEFVIQRVYLPKPDRKNFDPSIKSLSVTDRVRRANQERAVVFSEFSDQLRRDIAANKRVRVRKQMNDEEEQQGTLFYISKELNPQEIVELQDAVIKALISLRKIPPPMTMLDLPLFANCPYSKKRLEAGLESPKLREVFWNTVTNAPQPPLPPGFIRRKDDTLIYKDPKPYVVPEILQENSPHKQAVDMINYHQRKNEQDAKRMERRHTEKKIRTWASLKREFDMAETDDCPTSKLAKYDSMGSSRKEHQVTLQEIIVKMEGDSNGRLTGKIRASNSERNGESMQWINDRGSPDTPETEELTKKSETLNDHSTSFNNDRRSKALQDMMKNLSNPSLLPNSPIMRAFPPSDQLKNGPSTTPSMFLDPFNNNQPHYPFNPYMNSYQMAPAVNGIYQSRDPNDDHYMSIGASEVVHTEPSLIPFTYIHPDSGVRLTDPSDYLTTFVPSPITKAPPPINFPADISRCSSSEPSTSSSSSHEENNQEATNGGDVAEEESKQTIVDKFMKFDPPSIEE
uniref:Uncharacterized protein n=1 Tax=Caenorhabditis japonica TaxID=281687 RepID=A0A8R1DH26_CAEJA